MRDRVTTYGKSLYEEYRGEIRSNVIFSVCAAFVLTVLVFLVILTNFVLIKVKVSGSSMTPTLKTGDVVLVNVYGTPRRGDVIVISGEKENGDWLIKRAIALGGDSVKIEGGCVYLKKSGETDFAQVYEPYLNGEKITFYPDISDSDNTDAKIWEIEENQIFFLGDNRRHSHDSRAADFGTCETAQIVGTVSDLAIKLRGVNTFFEQVAQRINSLF